MRSGRWSLPVTTARMKVCRERPAGVLDEFQSARAQRDRGHPPGENQVSDDHVKGVAAAAMSRWPSSTSVAVAQSTSHSIARISRPIRLHALDQLGWSSTTRARIRATSVPAPDRQRDRELECPLVAVSTWPASDPPNGLSLSLRALSPRPAT